MQSRFGLYEVSLPPDREEIFLMQFPGLSNLYRKNRKVMKTRGGRLTSKTLIYGTWVPPSCCSLLVNLVNLILTLWTLRAQRSGFLDYWQPQFVRQELAEQFHAMQNMD